MTNRLAESVAGAHKPFVRHTGRNSPQLLDKKIFKAQSKGIIEYLLIFFRSESASDEGMVAHPGGGPVLTHEAHRYACRNFLFKQEECFF